MLTDMGIEDWKYSFNDITNQNCIVLYESGDRSDVSNPGPQH